MLIKESAFEFEFELELELKRRHFLEKKVCQIFKAAL